MKSANRPYVAAIDAIRGAAALLVLTYHCAQLIRVQSDFASAFDPSLHWVSTINPLWAVVVEGHAGVGLFIVLSGFVLTLGSRGMSISYSRFMAARVLRIYPVMVICIVVACLTGPWTWRGVLQSLSPFSVSMASPWTGMFWAVKVELQCYFLFPLLVMLRTRLLIAVIAATIAARLAAWMAYGVSPRDMSYWMLLGRLDQFCMGMVLARRQHALSCPGFAVSVAAAAMLLVCYNQLGGWPADKPWKLLWPTVEASMWACVIASVMRLETGHITRVFAYVGAASYSLYMVHFGVLATLLSHGIFLRTGGGGVADALVSGAVIVLPLSLLLGLAGYTLIEKPFLRARPRYLYPPDGKSPALVM